MPIEAPTIILLSALGIHAVAFWDAPRQWVRAKREAVITSSRVYHAANVAILVLLVAAAASESLWRTRPGFHPAGGAWPAASWAAVGVGVAGLLLASWAKRTLGPWFAPTAAKFPGRPVLRSGPYRWLRHPMYVGWWLFLAGLAWTTNSIVLLATATLLIPLLWVLGRGERDFLHA